MRDKIEEYLEYLSPWFIYYLMVIIPYFLVEGCGMSDKMAFIIQMVALTAEIVAILAAIIKTGITGNNKVDESTMKLQHDHASLQRDHADIIKDIGRNAEKLSEVEKQTSGIIAEIECQRREEEARRECLSAAQSDIDDRVRAVSTMAGEWKEKIMEVEELKQQIAELKRNNRNLKKVIEGQIRDLNETKQQLKEMCESNKSLSDEVEQLKKTVECYENPTPPSIGLSR